MAQITCPNVLTQGTCSDHSCQYEHNVYNCTLCANVFANQIAYNDHLSSKTHINKTAGETGLLLFCIVCEKYVSGMKNWQGHVSGAKHASKAIAKGMSPDVPPEEPEQVPGHQLCVVCNRHIPSRSWARHPMQAQHKEREQFLKFTSAVEDTEKDKNGVSVIGDFDFKIIELQEAASGVVRAGTIQCQIPATRMSLMDIRLSSAKGKATLSPFTVTLNNSIRTLSSRNSLNFSVKMTQNHLGRAEDRVELLFEDVRLKSRFIITRPLLIIVGSRADHDLLRPRVPYVPRKRTQRHPETNVVEGIAPPSTQAIPYVGRLPLATIPGHLSSTLSTGSTKEVLARLRRMYLPSVLDSETYSKHFKHLIWVEEFQMDRDLEYYDINDAQLKQHDSYYYLTVPGLAEKRPSVLVGDRIIVRRPSGSPGHWYEGGVHVVRRDEVGLRFHRSFVASAGERFFVRFKLNRFPMRRQHQALDSAFSQDRVLFPGKLHLSKSIPRTIGPSTLRWYNTLIAGNPPQKQAVLSITYREPGSMPFIIFGPPGTGKTVTMVEAILQVLATNSTSRIFACAPSNSAADLITSRLASAHLKVTELFRAYAPSRSKDDVPITILPHTRQNRDGHFTVYPMRDMLNFRVIVTTCVSASILSGIGMPRGHFSHIFVDEAGQATEPEVMIGIKSMSDNSTNIVLSGDPKQLGPIIRSSVARVLGLEMSYIERLMNRDIYDEVGGYGKSVVKLVKNFRSHSAILKFPNEKFYRGDLQCCGDPKTINFYINSQHLVKKNFPIVFHSISGKDDREASSPSFFNIDEVTQVKTLIAKLRSDRNQRITDNDIGVIAPYHAQVRKLRVALRPIADAVKVGSVEEFQGQERRVIIISTVRSSKEFVEYDLKHTLGFVANPRRFNVAVTRAQALLYVVGDPSVLSLDPLWRNFLNYIHKNGGWKGPPPTWDTRAPVDDNGKYDVSVRNAAQADMNEFTRMIEALTLNGVQALEDGEDEDQDVDHNIDRPWNEVE
ncbi:P-loop containing nucleoside triphosphate hydrolase protein [Lentinula edodes]|nr:P-loop containing nucleoside triphosphate hydrolase protein [Lentinula edodes]